MENGRNEKSKKRKLNAIFRMNTKLVTEVFIVINKKNTINNDKGSF